jgi:hypothetical protein
MAEAAAGSTDPANMGGKEEMEQKNEKHVGYEAPSIRILDEEELLKVFQMTAAEISVAACWWGACTAGCP